MSDVPQLEQDILAKIAAAPDEAALEAVRVEALGKNGFITVIARMVGRLPPEERKGRGAAINKIKDRVTEAIASRKNLLKEQRFSAELSPDDFVKYTNVTIVRPHL